MMEFFTSFSLVLHLFIKGLIWRFNPEWPIGMAPQKVVFDTEIRITVEFGLFFFSKGFETELLPWISSQLYFLISLIDTEEPEANSIL